MTADGTPRDTFTAGDSITDAGRGYPWTKNVDGTWWRVGQREPFTWEQILAWHQAALDNPDDETTEPFQPVLMVPAAGTYRPARAGAGATTPELPATMAEVPFAWVLVDADGIAWQVREDADGDVHIEPTLRKHEHRRYEASAWASWVEDFGPITVLHRPDAPQPAVPDDAGWCMDASCTRDAHDHSRRDGYYGD